MPSPDESQTARVLVLWDVDHTLIETRGVGYAIYQRAFPAATGRPLDQLAQIAGRTELDIMRETLRINDIEPTDDAVDKLAAALVQKRKHPTAWTVGAVDHNHGQLVEVQRKRPHILR